MALDKSKTDPVLGKEIHKHLILLGVETPMKETSKSDSEKITTIRKSFKSIMEEMGLDLSDDSLSETPDRVAKMYISELFWGLDYDNFPKVTTIKNKMLYENMLIERHIKSTFLCEHHYMSALGEAFVAYIPNEKVIGLSKINRIVEFFSRRPQVQERLTEQIFHTLCYVLGTDNVAVLVKAEHSCVRLRGVEDVNSDTITSRLGGMFLDEGDLRNEFYQSLKL